MEQTSSKLNLTVVGLYDHTDWGGLSQLSAVIECPMRRMDWEDILLLTAVVLVLVMLQRLLLEGADFVMLRGMLAGHDEGGGDVITKRYFTNESKRSKEN